MWGDLAFQGASSKSGCGAAACFLYLDDVRVSDVYTLKGVSD